MKFRSQTVHQKRSEVRFVAEISLVFNGIFRIMELTRLKSMFAEEESVLDSGVPGDLKGDG